MLPAAPKDVGRLSDVLVSAIASVGGATENRLRLPKVRHSVIVLVDGLGFENIQNAAGFARFLNQNLEHSIRCEFPSTTATSLAGLATGKRSGEHGLIGYSVFDRELGAQRNLLTGWSSLSEAKKFKKVIALSETLNQVRVRVIGSKSYEATGFTELTMKNAEYVAGESIEERFSALEKIFRSENSSVTYLYIPELDQTAHKFGVESNEWLHLLEELDMILNRFSNKLPKNAGVIVTADHGVLDIPASQHYLFDEQDWFTSAVLNTAGDPRCNFVYLKAGQDLGHFLEIAKQQVGHLAYVCTAAELVKTGWLVNFSQATSNLLPDLFVIWKEDMVGYDRRFSKPHHLELIGQHGAISDRETRIPLIKLGAY